MTVSSMTGFARTSGAAGDNSWSWELKSVNSRGLDLRCRLHGGLDSLEVAARAAAMKRFHRGNVTMNLTLNRTGATAEIRINEDVLGAILAAAAELATGEQEEQEERAAAHHMQYFFSITVPVE